MIYDFKDKKVLISGAAGGIGYAASLLFARSGAKVIMAGHQNPEKLNGLAEKIAGEGGIKPDCLICDFENIASVKDLAATVLDMHGHIDILVNNAAVSYFGLAQDITPDILTKLSSVNLSAPVMMCAAFIPSFIKRGSGRIINISSMWGSVGASCESAYSATKGGINSYTKALAKELAPSHIPVNAIAFGAVDTKMNARLTPEEKAEFEESIPYGRMATPEEAAMMILNVAAAPDYMTGQVIGFDGGFI